MLSFILIKTLNAEYLETGLKGKNHNFSRESFLEDSNNA